jgi:hypothetical protein
MPSTTRRTPTRSKQALAAGIHRLNDPIGGYPPEFDSEAHRKEIYRSWSDLLTDARAYQATEGWTEENYHLLAELYRQGHNMDVAESAQEAEETIETCLAEYPGSKRCHFSSIYFYLSLPPSFAPQAERSLTYLRAALAPKVDFNVERGFVVLYLYQQKLPEVVAQVDYCLAQFPDAPDRRFWELVRQAALDGSVVQQRLN